MKKVHLYRLCTLVLALALCVLPLAAAPDVPDPTADFYVGDFANVLSSDLEQYIIEQNQSLSASTGAQIVVVTVDFLDGYDIADYAVTLFNDWGIGSAEENNGYLILLAISDENYYSVPGQGIEDVFTGGTIDDLQWNYLEEDFAAGDYDAGVRSYFDAVLDVFEEQYGSISTVAPGSGVQQPVTSPNVYEPPRRSFSFGNIIIGLVVILILLAIIMTAAGRRTIYVAGTPYRRRWGFFGPMIPYRPRPPRPRRRPPPPPRPPRGGPGGFGGPGRPGGFGSFGGGGSTRGGGASRRSGGFSRPSGGASRRSGGFGGGARGGGGRSRGGGAGRRGR